MGTTKKQTRWPLKLITLNISCRRKRYTIEQLLQIFVHAGMTTKKRGTSRQKTQKSIFSWSIQFCTPIANNSENVQYDKTSLKNLTHWTKNLIWSNDAIFIDQQNDGKEKWIQFPSFTSERHSNPRSKTSMHLQKVEFFLVFLKQNFFPTLTDPPTTMSNNMFPYYLPQDIQCCKRSRTSKDN